MEAELRQCEYFLIRVVPDPIRNEFLNIGVALYDPEGGFADIRLIRDFQRIQCAFPNFNPDDVRGLADDLRQRLATREPHWTSRDYLLEWARESFAQSLQLTPPNAVFTVDPAVELDLLFRRYASIPMVGERIRIEGPRRRVLRRLQQVFEEERLLRRLRANQRIADLIPERDPFRFDFYYKPNGVHHFIQAVALNGTDAGIKELSFTASRLRRLLAGPAAGLDITAVTDDPDPALPGESAEARQVHREWLEEAGIQLVPLEQVRELTTRIKHHLQVE